MAGSAPDPGKVAVVQSIAANGSAGPAMLAAQQSDLASQQANAVNAASQRAGMINAPADFLKQQAAMVAQPYNTASAQDTARVGALNSYLGSLGQANNNYMSELKAAMPVVQANIDKASSGANLSQLIQLYNLKQNMDKSNEANQQIAQQKQDQQVQQEALNNMLKNQNDPASRAAMTLVGSYKDLPSAIADLNSPDGQAALQKNFGLKDDTQVRQMLTQYFDPQTYQQLQPIWAAQAAQKAAVPTAAAPAPAKSSGSSLPSWLGNIAQTLSGFGA